MQFYCDFLQKLERKKFKNVVTDEDGYEQQIKQFTRHKFLKKYESDRKEALLKFDWPPSVVDLILEQ